VSVSHSVRDSRVESKKRGRPWQRSHHPRILTESQRAWRKGAQRVNRSHSPLSPLKGLAKAGGSVVFKGVTWKPRRYWCHVRTEMLWVSCERRDGRCHVRAEMIWATCESRDDMDLRKHLLRIAPRSRLHLRKGGTHQERPTSNNTLEPPRQRHTCSFISPHLARRHHRDLHRRYRHPTLIQRRYLSVVYHRHPHPSSVISTTDLVLHDHPRGRQTHCPAPYLACRPNHNVTGR
jgi:hypothetical protein